MHPDTEGDNMSQPRVVVHPPSEGGGRQVEIGDRILGTAKSLHDLTLLLRNVGLSGWDELDVASRIGSSGMREAQRCGNAEHAKARRFRLPFSTHNDWPRLITIASRAMVGCGPGIRAACG